MADGGTTDLITALDRLIEAHHLLKHPFYQAWTAGSLDRESLQLYAAQYYQHVRAFPEHLTRLARRADGALRSIVEENLAEEVNPASPHPKLWRDFAAALGVDESSLDGENPLPGIRDLIETYRELSERASIPEAVAAFYAYESQVPEIAAQKIAGLRRVYGISAPSALAYFAVHQEADLRHRAAWRGWLAQEEADEASVLCAAERGLKALWGALDAVYPACIEN